MRKVLSLLLVVVMLVGMIVLPTSTSATTQLEDNVAASANYFGGTLIYKENFDKGDQYEDPITVKTGKTGTITLDGDIKSGEWGDPMVTVDSRYAANNISALGSYITDKRPAKNDAMFNEPSAENTYFYGTDKCKGDFSYDLYFLWDEDYFYVAAHVNDPYNFRNNHERADTWDGDCIQFRVDVHGPNSAAVKDGTTYKYRAEHGIRTEIVGKDKFTTYDNKPWEGSIPFVDSWNDQFSPVPNFVFAYTKASEGHTECYDSALRYNPHGEPDSIENPLAWDGAPILSYYADYWDENGGGAYAVVKPVNHGTVGNPDYTIDYEIAIPWCMMNYANEDGTFQNTFAPQVGSELGFSIAAINSDTTSEGYNSWLGWGSGVCGYQTQIDYQTAGGSNLLTLSDTGYKSYTACAHNFAPANCDTPETCTLCGYQRGYEKGHSWTCSNVVLPTATEAGSTVAKCSVCKQVKTIELASEPETRYFGFKETDTEVFEEMITDGNGWIKNWGDGVESETYMPAQLFYDNGTDLISKTALDFSTFEGKAVFDSATNGEGLFYASGEKAVIQEGMTFEDQTGTYYDVAPVSDKNFAFSSDLYFPEGAFEETASFNLPEGYVPVEEEEEEETTTEEGTETEPVEKEKITGDRYTNGVYAWFGKSSTSYMGGLFVFNAYTDNPTYMFAIAPTDICYALDEDVETFKANALVYKEVSLSTIATGEWHNFMFVYDDDAQVALVYWDNKLQVAAHDALFKYQLDDARMIIHRQHIPFYATNLNYGTSAYASTLLGDAPVGSTYKVTVDGEVNEYAAGEDVTVTVAGFYLNENGKAMRFDTWKDETSALDAVDLRKASFTFTMPEEDVTLNSTYYLIGDLSGDGKINPPDAVSIKRVIVGLDEKNPIGDIDNDGKYNAVDASNLKSMILGLYTPEK